MFTQFRLLNTNYSITPMVFAHWLIEASSVPIILAAAFVEYYIEWSNNFFDKYPLYFIVVILIKVPLFVLMRYAECELDFVVNDLKVSFFEIFCKRF